MKDFRVSKVLSCCSLCWTVLKMFVNTTVNDTSRIGFHPTSFSYYALFKNCTALLVEHRWWTDNIFRNMKKLICWKTVSWWHRPCWNVRLRKCHLQNQVLMRTVQVRFIGHYMLSSEAWMGHEVCPTRNPVSQRLDPVSHGWDFGHNLCTTWR